MNSSTREGISITGVTTRGTVIINQLKGEKRKRYSFPSENEVNERPSAPRTRELSSLLHSAEAEHTFNKPPAVPHDVGNTVNSEANVSEETDSVGTEEQSVLEESPKVAKPSTHIRKYAQRQRPTLDYSGQMNKIAYPQGYRQYRPRRPTKKRMTSPLPLEAEQPMETEQNQHDVTTARNNGSVPEADELMQIDDLPPSTPVQPPGIPPTPETRRTLRPRWQETTLSQIGVSYDGLDNEDVEPVWEDSIIDVYDDKRIA